MVSETKRLLYPFPEAADLIGVKRTTLYALVSQGELDQVKIGRRSLITADSLSQYVSRLMRRGCDA